MKLALVVLAGLACAAQAEEEITALVVDGATLYEGTSVGLVVRDASDPRHATWLKRSDRLARRLAADRPSYGDQIIGARLARRYRTHEWPIAGEDATHVLPASRVVGVLVDGAGRLWVATSVGFARREADGRWTAIASPLPDSSVCGLERAGADVWAVFCEGGVARYAGTTWVGHGDFHGGVGVPSTLDAFGAADGTLTVAVLGGGLARCRRDGCDARRFHDAKADWIARVVVDERGTTWAGLDRGEPYGLLRADGRRFEVITALPSLRVTALAPRPGGGALVGTDRGVVVVREGRPLPLEGLPAGVHVTALASSGEAAWIGDVSGHLWRVADGRAERFDAVVPPLGGELHVIARTSVLGHFGGSADEYEVVREGGKCWLSVAGDFVSLPPMPVEVSCNSVVPLFERMDVASWPWLDDSEDDGGSMHTGFVELSLSQHGRHGWQRLARSHARDIFTGGAPQARAWRALHDYAQQVLPLERPRLR